MLSFICILMICFEALMVTPSRILACLFRLRICRVTNGITVLMVKYSSSFRNICSLYYAALRIQFYLYSEFAYKFSCLAKPVLAFFSVTRTQHMPHKLFTCLWQHSQEVWYFIYKVYNTVDARWVERSTVHLWYTSSLSKYTFITEFCKAEELPGSV